MENVKAKKIMHALTWAFLAAAIAFGVFHFGLPIAQRLWMALCDLGRSIAAYGILLFTAGDGAILPTVQEFPEGMDTVLPISWEELELFMAKWWEIFKDGKTILAYLWLVLENISQLLLWISLALLPLAMIVLVLWLTHRGIDNDYAMNTKAVEAFERFRRTTWARVKNAIKAYSDFVWKRWYYWLAFALIWAYNLNILTIAIEAVAWYFYLSWAGGLAGLPNIVVQVAKFAVDFSVAAIFIPGIGWAMLGYWLFSLWRRHLGKKALKRCIDHGYEFIDRYPGTLFVHGKQRSKKTSMLTTLKLLYERVFRERAEKKILLRDKQFPFFPWIRLEKFINQARERHQIYMLYHCRAFVRMLRKTESLSGKRREIYMKLLRRYYGYEYDDCYFGYDTAYGLEYDDGLTVIHIYDALEMYAQLFFIYHQTTPLDLSNLAIREDFTWKDHGNFPIFDGDFLKKTSYESNKASKYSHVIDFDAFRPGLKFDPDNPNKDAVEHGIVVIQEVDKERKNSKTRSAAGNKAAGELGIATQDNDGFEIDFKVRGQVALVDNVDFFAWLVDAQRVGDLGSSIAELTNQIYIKGRAEERLILPFFEIEDALFSALTWLYNKIHLFFRSRKGSNVLLHHLIKLFFEPFFKAYDRIEKQFTVWKLRVKVKDGGDGEDLGEEYFYIPQYVTYRDRFASDVCKAFYEYRFAKSKRGIDDIECYDDTETDVKKMVKQKSFFSEDMTVYNGIDSERKRVEQKGNRGKKSPRGK